MEEFTKDELELLQEMASFFLINQSLTEEDYDKSMAVMKKVVIAVCNKE